MKKIKEFYQRVLYSYNQQGFFIIFVFVQLMENKYYRTLQSILDQETNANPNDIKETHTIKRKKIQKNQQVRKSYDKKQDFKANKINKVIQEPILKPEIRLDKPILKSKLLIPPKPLIHRFLPYPKSSLQLSKYSPDSTQNHLLKFYIGKQQFVVHINSSVIQKSTKSAEIYQEIQYSLDVVQYEIQKNERRLEKSQIFIFKKGYIGNHNNNLSFLQYHRLQEETRHLLKRALRNRQNKFTNSHTVASSNQVEAQCQLLRLLKENRYYESFMSIRNYLGLIFLDKRQYKQAIQHFLSALRIYGTSQTHKNVKINDDIIKDISITVYALGVISIDFKQYKQAQFFFQTYVKINPQCCSGLNSLGVVYYYLDKFEDSFQVISKALKLQKMNQLALINKDFLLFHAKSSVDLKKYLKKKKQSYEPAILFNLSYLNFNLNNTDEANKCLNKALQVQSNFSEALHNKAIILFELKQQLQAIKTLQQAIKINSQQFQSFLVYGHFIQKLGIYELRENLKDIQLITVKSFSNYLCFAFLFFILHQDIKYVQFIQSAFKEIIFNNRNGEQYYQDEIQFCLELISFITQSDISIQKDYIHLVLALLFHKTQNKKKFYLHSQTYMNAIFSNSTFSDGTSEDKIMNDLSKFSIEVRNYLFMLIFEYLIENKLNQGIFLYEKIREQDKNLWLILNMKNKIYLKRSQRISQLANFIQYYFIIMQQNTSQLIYELSFFIESKYLNECLSQVKLIKQILLTIERIKEKTRMKTYSNSHKLWSEITLIMNQFQQSRKFQLVTTHFLNFIKRIFFKQLGKKRQINATIWDLAYTQKYLIINLLAQKCHRQLPSMLAKCVDSYLNIFCCSKLTWSSKVKNLRKKIVKNYSKLTTQILKKQIDNIFEQQSQNSS